jgi:hypothetical protein
MCPTRFFWIKSNVTAESVVEIAYMKHLNHDHSYLFSPAMRLNPMLEHPDPLV